MTKRHGSTNDPHGGAARIRSKAITLFRERGYHGTSIRDLAQAAQMETASLYYHYRSKQDLLVDVFTCTMDDLNNGIQSAVAGVAGAEQRLVAAVRFHVLFHLTRQDEATISHSELRALNKEPLRYIVAQRDRYEKFLRALLQAGVDDGCFDIEDVGVTTIAILMMCSGVSDWFQRRGRLSGEAIAAQYGRLVLRMVLPQGQARKTAAKTVAVADEPSPAAAGRSTRRSRGATSTAGRRGSRSRTVVPR